MGAAWTVHWFVPPLRGSIYRVVVLGFAPQAIACHASGVPNGACLPSVYSRRSERCLRSKCIFDASNRLKKTDFHSRAYLSQS